MFPPLVAEINKLWLQSMNFSHLRSVNWTDGDLFCYKRIYFRNVITPVVADIAGN